jgi:hypothetical protein
MNSKIQELHKATCDDTHLNPRTQEVVVGGSQDQDQYRL